MAGWSAWCQQQPWTTVGWLLWCAALLRWLRQARIDGAFWEPWLRPPHRARQGRLPALALMVCGWALLLLSLPHGAAGRWLAVAPGAAAAGWFGGPYLLGVGRSMRRERRLRRRLLGVVELAGRHAAAVAAAPGPGTAGDWLAVAGQTLSPHDPEAARRAWRCLDRARALTGPGDLCAIAQLEAQLAVRPDGQEPELLADLEAATRTLLQALDQPALAASQRAMLTARAYAGLRELEPGLDPVSASWLWWRATGSGQDREQWLRAAERLARREPVGVAPELLLVEPLQASLRTRAAVPCAAPRMRGAVWALDRLAEGTWCRPAKTGRASCDGTVGILLEAGAHGQAVDRLSQDQPGSRAALARWAAHRATPETLAEVAGRVASAGLHHPALVLAALATAAGRFRLAQASPTLDIIEAGLDRLPPFEPIPVQLALALAWATCQPERSLASLRPLLDARTPRQVGTRAAAGKYRQAVIEVVARLRLPEVDDLLAGQVADGRGRADLPAWWLAALAAMARRGSVTAQDELDGLAPGRQDEPREYAGRLGLLAACGAAGGLALAADYVHGRRGAGPPAAWVPEIRESCRLRMLEQWVAGQVYRRYTALAIAAVRGPCPATSNRWAEEFGDALPLTA